MATSKPKLIVAVAALVLLGFIGGILWNVFDGSERSTRQVRVPPATEPTASSPPIPEIIPAKPASQWLPKFTSVYTLADGQAVKYVPAPFLPERLEFLRSQGPIGRLPTMSQGPDSCIFADSAHHLRIERGLSRQPSVAEMIQMAMGLRQWEFIAPPELQRVKFKGDIVVRNASTPAQNAPALVALGSQLLGRKLTLESKQMPRPTLIVGGRARYRGPATTRASTIEPALKDAARHPTTPYIDASVGPSTEWSFVMVNQKSQEFCRQLADICNLRVIAEGPLANESMSWIFDRSAYRIRRADGPSPEGVQRLLDSIQDQSELTFRRDALMNTVWVLSESGPGGALPNSLPATTAPLR